VVEDLPPKELYNDLIAVARLLEAQFPDKVKIVPVSAENIKEMEVAVGCMRVIYMWIKIWIMQGGIVGCFEVSAEFMF